MKPSSFEYLRPQTVRECVTVLGEDVEDTKVLAGGQSLIPLMNMRLARPNRVVDINDLGELSGLSWDGDFVRIGALTRHVEIERCTVEGPTGSLLRRGAGLIGHLPIRVRGTFGGSLAHGDPLSEWCIVAGLLDATVVAGSLKGERRIPATEFFLSTYMTALEPDELITSVLVPNLSGEHRTGLVEFARQPGDFAIVAVGVDLTVMEGAVSEARVCLGGVASRPYRSSAAERALVGQALEPSSIQQAAEAAAEDVDPPDDINGSSSYRRHLVRSLLVRVLERGLDQ